MRATVIAVVGQGGPDVEPELLGVATDIGRALAAAGAVLVCGGLDGVMAAAASGARSGGGVTIGLLPGTDPTAANPYLTVALPTGLGEARNTLVVRAADAVIAVGGGYGTLSEIGFALKTGAAVIGLRTWELRRDSRVDDGITVVDTAPEAVRAALTAARGRMNRPDTG